MPEGYEHVSIEELSTNSEKPGRRWELSPRFDIEGCNVNVAVLEPGERLSQSHYHYHEAQRECIYVAVGRCRAEVADGRLELETDDVVAFDGGPTGAHVVYNHADEPCKLLALGWPPEDRHPVEQVSTLEALLEERYG